nr:phasin family protein [uncultured Lichenicoccus sp.]
MSSSKSSDTDSGKNHGGESATSRSKDNAAASVAASKDAVSSAMAASRDAATATFAASKDAVASASVAYRDLSKRTLDMTTKVVAFNQGTLAAYSEAGRIFASETQAIFRHMVKSSQTGTAESLSGVRALLSAKTLKERLELQSALSRTAAIWAISETSGFARTGIELFEKVSAPIAARAYLAAQTFDNAIA